ncbi:DNA methyltransferase [Pseudomonas cerasi]
MSRFIQGNCIQIMSGFPDKAVDFILTDPPYLVGFCYRAGRTIAGDQTDEWLQLASHEMYRVLKNDSLMVSFYGWNRADHVISAWTAAGFRFIDLYMEAYREAPALDACCKNWLKRPGSPGLITINGEC